jgi:hypothetical protein
MNKSDNVIPGGSTGHLNEDLCLDLIHGLLSRRAADQVMDHAASCAACEEMLRMQAARMERLRSSEVYSRLADRDLPRDAEQWLASSRSREDLSGTARPLRETTLIARLKRRLMYRHGLPYAAGLVAATAAVLLLVWPAAHRSPDVADLTWMPSATIIFNRGDGSSSSRDLEDALTFYGKHDLNTSIRLLEHADATGQSDVIRRIYLGNALAHQQRYGEAIQILRSLSAEPIGEPWGGEMRWTLLVSLRESGGTASADSLLAILSKEPGEIGERARALANRESRRR